MRKLTTENGSTLYVDLSVSFRHLTQENGRAIFVNLEKIVYVRSWKRGCGSVLQFKTGWKRVFQDPETISKSFKQLTGEDGEAIYVNP